MPKLIGKTEALTKMSQLSTRLNSLSLPGKIAELKRSPSSDRVQQLQTEAIIELYEAVKELQEAVWPMLLVIPDGIEAAREAAAKGSSTASSTMLSAASRLVSGTRITR